MHKKGKKKIRVILFSVFSGLFFMFLASSSLMAVPLSQLEENIRGAILGTKNFSAQELKEMDLNENGVVDVADIVRYRWLMNNGIPLGLEWYQWIVVASFPSEYAWNDDNVKHVAPVTYSFGLQFDNDVATVIEIPGFDPTKGILRQDIAQRGETAGLRRPRYAVSQVMPAGTKFSVSEKGNRVTLETTITVNADDRKNPTGVTYKRLWTIELDKDLINSMALNHGTCTERTKDFVPETMRSVGSIYIVPFSPKELATIGAQ